MTEREISAALVETLGDLDKETQTFSDRLLLRIHSSPSLLAALVDVAVIGEGDTRHLQLKFFRLPDTILPQVEQMIDHEGVKVFKFDEDGRSFHAFEIPLKQAK